MRMLLAAIATIAVQPLVYLLWGAAGYVAFPQSPSGLAFVVMSILLVAGAVVLLLGIPAFLILRRHQHANRASLALTGFVLGSLPAAIHWPNYLTGFSAGQYWHGKLVDTFVDGEPTICAWLIFGENVVYFGLQGLVGGLVFHAVWRRVGRPDE